MQTIKFWWKVLWNSVSHWLECSAFTLAGSLAFYTLFSLAPVVIIAVTVIGVIFGNQAAEGQIVAEFQHVMGTEAATVVEQAVSKSRIQESGILPTVAGILALIIGATTVFAQMQHSLNVIWGVTSKPWRSNVWIFLKKRILSLMVVLAIGFVLLVSLLLEVTLRAALKFTANFLPFIETLMQGSEVLVSFVIITMLFATIFKVLPDVILSWRQVLLGSVVTAALFSLGRFGIATYLAYTATASTYGAAGSVVLILLWVYYSSLILLFGVALTKTYLTAKGINVRPRTTAVFVEKQYLE